MFIIILFCDIKAHVCQPRITVMPKLKFSVSKYESYRFRRTNCLPFVSMPHPMKMSVDKMLVTDVNPSVPNVPREHIL